MIISYPFLPARSGSESEQDYERRIFGMEMSEAGFYPASYMGSWHGGIHLKASQTEPVRAVADGELVAYRLNNDLTKERASDAQGIIDNSFVLIKHETESNSVSDENGNSTPVRVVYYSLYMHLMNQGEMKALGLLGKSVAVVATPTGQNISPGNRAKILRKDVIGFPGQSYASIGVIHFEIFTTEDALSAFFVNSSNSATLGAAGIWGDTYYIIKAGTAFQADHPSMIPPPGRHRWVHRGRTYAPGTAGHADATKNLFVRISFRAGSKYTTTWIDEGPGEPPTLLTSNDGAVETGYEYSLYRIAVALYPSCPSAGYEMLRFGRVLGPDKSKLVAAEVHNWQMVTYTEGKSGYVDLADGAVVSEILTDADFPYWLGWQKAEKALFDYGDGRCDMSAMLNVLRVKYAASGVDLEQIPLSRHIRDSSQLHAAQWVKRLICKFPSEWDEKNNTRLDFLKQPRGISAKQDGPYFGVDSEYNAHIEFVKSLQWWSSTNIGASEVWHFHPLEFVRHFRKCGWLSEMDFSHVYPDSNYTSVGKAGADYRELYRFSINMVLRKYGLAKSPRISHFFGQVAIETFHMMVVRESSVAMASGIRNNNISILPETGGYLRETAGNARYTRYFSRYENSRPLANTSPGDGIKFRGRGFNMVTGRYNYAEYWVYRGWLESSSYNHNWVNVSNAVGPDISNPEKLGDDAYSCVDSAGFFSVRYGIPKAADNGVTEVASNAVSSIVNRYDTTSFSGRWGQTRDVDKVFGD